MKFEIYVIREIGGRADDLIEAEQQRGYFAEAVHDDLHRRGGPRLPCLISFTSGQVTHVASLSVGNKAAEGRKRVNVREVRELSIPLRISALVERITSPDKVRVQDRLRQGGLVSGDAAQKLLNAIGHFDPDLARRIGRFALDQARIDALPEQEKRALALEKEMVAAALEFSGLDKTELTDWRLPDRDGGSFLDGLEQVRLREDAMVVHDMINVPGFELVRSTAYSAAVFQSGNTRLTVVLANHLAIEEQVGADLLYFNERLRAFTIVQYKAMEHKGTGSPVFRFPDTKLQQEIDRMRVHLEILKTAPPDGLADGFRLLDNPFYIKLCPRIQFDVGDPGMIKGMYLPLDYFSLLEQDPHNRGLRGGGVLSFDNVHRYFDNTSFIHLVKNGWIGTTINQSRMLDSIIRQVLRSSRPVTLAVAKESPL